MRIRILYSQRSAYTRLLPLQYVASPHTILSETSSHSANRALRVKNKRKEEAGSALASPSAQPLPHTKERVARYDAAPSHIVVGKENIPSTGVSRLRKRDNMPPAVNNKKEKRGVTEKRPAMVPPAARNHRAGSRFRKKSPRQSARNETKKPPGDKLKGNKTVCSSRKKMNRRKEKERKRNIRHETQNAERRTPKYFSVQSFAFSVSNIMAP